MRRVAGAQVNCAHDYGPNKRNCNCNLSVFYLAPKDKAEGEAGVHSRCASLLHRRRRKDLFTALRMAAARCALALALLAAPTQALAARRRSPVRMSIYVRKSLQAPYAIEAMLS